MPCSRRAVTKAASACRPESGIRIGAGWAAMAGAVASPGRRYLRRVAQQSPPRSERAPVDRVGAGVRCRPAHAGLRHRTPSRWRSHTKPATSAVAGCVLRSGSGSRGLPARGGTGGRWAVLRQAHRAGAPGAAVPARDTGGLAVSRAHALGPTAGPGTPRSEGPLGPGARAFVFVIRVYQGVRSGRPSPCRFVPSCSAYGVEAIERHGAARGSWLTLRRLSRCRPWGGLGHDPVPD